MRKETRPVFPRTPVKGCGSSLLGMLLRGATSEVWHPGGNDTSVKLHKWILVVCLVPVIEGCVPAPFHGSHTVAFGTEAERVGVMTLPVVEQGHDNASTSSFVS